MSQQTLPKRHQHEQGNKLHIPSVFEKVVPKLLNIIIYIIRVILFQWSIVRIRTDNSQKLRPSFWKDHPDQYSDRAVALASQASTQTARLDLDTEASTCYQWRRAWSNHHKAVSLCCATISEQILRLSPWFDQQGSVPTPGVGLLETHVTFWHVFTLVKTPSLTSRLCWKHPVYMQAPMRHPISLSWDESRL
jgi:hypothetical protein